MRLESHESLGPWVKGSEVPLLASVRIWLCLGRPWGSLEGLGL